MNDVMDNDTVEECLLQNILMEGNRSKAHYISKVFVSSAYIHVNIDKNNILIDGLDKNGVF